MRKSQIISLIILLVLVTIVIWVGACTGEGKGPMAKPTPTEDLGPTLPVETAEPTPEVPEDEIAGLPSDTITWTVSRGDGNVTPNVDSYVLEQMAKYDCYYEGSSFSDSGAYITFDVSYGDDEDIKNISSALDALKASNTKAIFFLTNEFFKGQVSDIVKRIVEEGHQLGNRGKIVDGNDMTKLTRAEYYAAVTENEESLKKILGEDAKMTYYRPLGNRFSIRDLAIVKQLGYKTIMWTSLYAGDNLDSLTARISNELRDRSVFDIMVYCIHQQTDKLTEALNKAASLQTLKQLP